jgi:hypothetical protein
VYDFATSDTEYTQLIPMGIEAYQRNGFVCSQFSQIESSMSYFPILREDNWENVPYKLVDTSSAGMEMNIAH